MKKSKASVSIQKNEVITKEKDEVQKIVMSVTSKIRTPQDKKKDSEKDYEDESESDSKDKGTFKLE